MDIKLLTPTAKIPTLGSANAAGYDLYAELDSPKTILPHTTELIKTGIAMAIPAGYFGAIFARSGLATKRSLRPANCVGVIDSDYRGEVMVALHNDSNKEQTIDPHERIAQLIIMPYALFPFNIVESLDETERGAGGFGHTGSF